MRNEERKSREEAFNDVKDMSMVDPEILSTQGYKIVENDFLKEINVGPEYKCEICCTWNYKSNVLKFNASKYNDDILQKCYEVPSERNTTQHLWICHTCDKSLKKKKDASKSYS